MTERLKRFKMKLNVNGIGSALDVRRLSLGLSELNRLKNFHLSRLSRRRFVEINIDNLRM